MPARSCKAASDITPAGRRVPWHRWLATLFRRVPDRPPIDRPEVRDLPDCLKHEIGLLDVKTSRRTP